MLVHLLSYLSHFLVSLFLFNKLIRFNILQQYRMGRFYYVSYFSAEMQSYQKPRIMVHPPCVLEGPPTLATALMALSCLLERTQCISSVWISTSAWTSVPGTFLAWREFTALDYSFFLNSGMLFKMSASPKCHDNSVSQATRVVVDGTPEVFPL